MSFPRASSKSDRVVIKGAKDCVDGAVSRINEIVSDLVSRWYTVFLQISYYSHLCIIQELGLIFASSF